jgi:GDP-L-fucose synthase
MLLGKYDKQEPINIGSGREIAIDKLAFLIADVIGFTGEILFNSQRPNGTPRKLLDCTKISNLGWKPTIELEAGVASTYDWFLSNYRKVLTA